MDGTPRRVSIGELTVIHEDGHFRLPQERKPCDRYSCGCECKECLRRAERPRMAVPAPRQPWMPLPSKKAA